MVDKVNAHTKLVPIFGPPCIDVLLRMTDPVKMDDLMTEIHLFYR